MCDHEPLYYIVMVQEWCRNHYEQSVANEARNNGSNVQFRV